MIAIKATHSKMEDLLHPYIDEDHRKNRIQKYCHDQEQITLMDEKLNDFGCKYWITIEREVNSSSSSDIIVSVYVGIIGWECVKTSAISALSSSFGDANVKSMEQLQLSSNHRNIEDGMLTDYNVLVQVGSSQKQRSFESSLQTLYKIRFIILGNRLKEAFRQLQDKSFPQNHDEQETFEIPTQRVDNNSEPIIMYVTMFGCERVTIAIPISFQHETDRALAKVFVQQFQQSQQRSSAKHVPICDFRRPNEPPREILKLLSNKSKVHEGCKKHGDVVGYLSLTFFHRHFNSGKNEDNNEKDYCCEDNVVETILLFYEFLDYHIKCSKSYVHTRLREKKDAMLERLLK